jgi:drug/metabolite transporter, DME family
MPIGLFCLFAAGLFLGTGGLTGRLLAGTTGLSPVAVAGYRLTVGGLLILAFLVLTDWRPPRRRAAWARVAVVGVLVAGYQACYFASVSLTTVSFATLVAIGAFPILVALLERATGRRRIDRRTLGTVSLALAGLGLLVGLPSDGFSAAAVAASASLAVAAAGGFATVSVIVARPVPELRDLSTAGLGFTVGGLLLLPVASATVGLGFAPSGAAIGELAALGTVPTALAYALYFRGLATVSATTAALMTLLEPLTVAVLAAVLLGDRLGAAGIAGAILLAAAVILTARTADEGSGPVNQPRTPVRRRLRS